MNTRKKGRTMGALTGEPKRLKISYSCYTEQYEAIWPGVTIKKMGHKLGTSPRIIRTNGHIYLVHVDTRDEDIPEHLWDLIERWKFSNTGTDGRIKMSRKGYKPLFGERVNARRLSWAWDINVPTDVLETTKIKKDLVSEIQKKRDRQPYKDKDMPKKTTGKAKVVTMDEIKTALDELEDIGVTLRDMIDNGVLTKDMIKQYLDTLFEPTDEE